MDKDLAEPFREKKAAGIMNCSCSGNLSKDRKQLMPYHRWSLGSNSVTYGGRNHLALPLLVPCGV